jgi:hypothetical protein
MTWLGCPGLAGLQSVDQVDRCGLILELSARLSGSGAEATLAANLFSSTSADRPRAAT